MTARLRLLVVALAFFPLPAAAADLTLAWDPATDGITTGYIVYVGPASGVYTRQIDAGAATSYTVTGLAPGVTYYFTVRARSAAGDLSAPASEVHGMAPGTASASAAAGDLNADGLRDLLFQHTSGDLYAWHMSGVSLASGGWLTPSRVDPPWRVAAVRDFTGDGQPDLVIQNDQTGAVKLWVMAGLVKTAEQDLAGAVGASWTLAAAADLNGDAFNDLVWENTATRSIYVWLMKPAGGWAGLGGAQGAFLGDYVRDLQGDAVTVGPVAPAGASMPVGPVTRRVAGAGDVDADGQTDLVWQDSATGEVGVSYLSALVKTADAPLDPGLVSPEWRIRAVGDYDGDGSVDVLWQNTTTGELYAWFMHGPRAWSVAPLTPNRVNPAWRLVGP